MLINRIRIKNDPNIWKNTFTASYIEDLTQKTGIRKSYKEFVKILINTLKTPNLMNISIDILTYEDLENIKGE